MAKVQRTHGIIKEDIKHHDNTEADFPYTDLPERPLGKGSYSIVIKVEHRDTKDVFACKILEYSKGQLDVALQVLKREAEIIYRLRHPHIIQAVETFTIGRELRIILKPV